MPASVGNSTLVNAIGAFNAYHYALARTGGLPPEVLTKPQLDGWLARVARRVSPGTPLPQGLNPTRSSPAITGRVGDARHNWHSLLPRPHGSKDLPREREDGRCDRWRQIRIRVTGLVRVDAHEIDREARRQDCKGATELEGMSQAEAVAGSGLGRHHQLLARQAVDGPRGRAGGHDSVDQDGLVLAGDRIEECGAGMAETDGLYLMRVGAAQDPVFDCAGHHPADPVVAEGGSEPD